MTRRLPLFFFLALCLAGAAAKTGVSRDLWGRAEYALFGQGRAGVVMGRDGWLFTESDYGCPKGMSAALKNNIVTVAKTRDLLKTRGATLTVALIPGKARVAPQAPALPRCRAGFYDEALTLFQQSGIDAVDLRGALSFPGAFLKTDTHWTPEGAQAVAQAVAKNLPRTLPRQVAQTVWGNRVARKGDLRAFLPGVDISAEQIRRAETTLTHAALTDDLPPPAVTLVGTSYSADPAWNFGGFLKEALQADVLIAARAGQDPFAAMTAYLSGLSRARAVVWEIPERFLTTAP